MKALFISACLVAVIASQASAQFFNASHVPLECKLVVQNLYPKATGIQWTKQQEGYEAAFLLHHKPHFILFDLQGAFVAEVAVLSPKALPRRIRKHLHDTYKSFRLEDALMLTTSNGDIRYETQIAAAEEEFKLIFNNSGYIIEVMPLTSEVAE